MNASKQNISSKGTHYELLGEARPVVVLIHGLGLTKDMWWKQVDALLSNFRVLIYDLTGSGQSALPKSTPDLSMFSRQLADLLDELKIKKVAVAGFSLGGMIARRFAMDYPDRLWALAILHSAHMRDKDAHDAIQARVYQAQEEGPQSTVEAALSRWFSRNYRLSNQDEMDWVRETILANDKEVYPKNYQVLVAGVDELIAPQPVINCATLVMTGEEDYGNSVEMTREIAAEIEGAKTVILPALRHMAMVENPDLFNQHLLAFLNDLNMDLTHE